jgi:hypothetical protein
VSGRGAALDADKIEAMLMSLAQARADGTISPTDVARALGGVHPEGWGPLMQPIRRVAVRLMKEGRIVILRKGRPVDPDGFKGVYRIALPALGSGAGNSASV